MVIYKSSVEQRAKAKDRDRQLWEHRSVWVGAVSVQSCQILTPPLGKKPEKKKKDPSPRNRRKNDAGKDRALATELSSAKSLDQQDLDRELKEAKQ